MSCDICGGPVPGGQIGSGSWATGARVLGRIDAIWSTTGVGKSTVLLSAVVTDGMGPQELAVSPDLDGVALDGHLDLVASIGVADPIGGAGEADGPLPSTLRTTTGTSLRGVPARRWPGGRRVIALGWVSPGVRGHQHVVVEDLEEAVFADTSTFWPAR